MSASLFRVWTMSLIHVDTRNNATQLQMQVGEAAMYLEQRRLWEEGLRPLVTKACVTVRQARAVKEQHLGDLLYCSLVHCIDQIVSVVVRQDGSFQPHMEIDLRFPMERTGAWKPEAQLRNIVAVAVWILQPYQSVDPSDPTLILGLLEEFEIIWVEVISPLFDGRAGLLGRFQDGGDLSRKLLGDRLYEPLSAIRTKLKTIRADSNVTDESGASAPTAK